MSRGYWDYKNEALEDELFGWDNEHPRNVFRDMEITHLVKDVFRLIYALDSWECGDWGEEHYREEIQKFKDKWLKRERKEILQEIVDKSVEELRSELYKMIGDDVA